MATIASQVSVKATIRDRFYVRNRYRRRIMLLSNVIFLFPSSKPTPSSLFIWIEIYIHILLNKNNYMQLPVPVTLCSKKISSFPLLIPPIQTNDDPTRVFSPPPPPWNANLRSWWSIHVRPRFNLYIASIPSGCREDASFLPRNEFFTRLKNQIHGKCLRLFQDARLSRLIFFFFQAISFSRRIESRVTWKRIKNEIDRFTRDRFKRRDKYESFTPPDLNFLSPCNARFFNPFLSTQGRGFQYGTLGGTFDPWNEFIIHPHSSSGEVTKELDGRRDGDPGVERRVLSESLDCPSPLSLNSKLFPLLPRKYSENNFEYFIS